MTIEDLRRKNLIVFECISGSRAYGLYYTEKEDYQGLTRSKDSHDLCLSSIPKHQQQACLLYFNRDGYSKYCKEHKEYWEWVEKRNENRYQNTQSHGKNYDAKNMMHVFRLLEMATEIAKEHQVNVIRPNRDFLLSIKSGDYEYNDLLELAEVRKKEMEAAFELSTLAEKTDLNRISQLSFLLREGFYGGQIKEKKEGKTVKSIPFNQGNNGHTHVPVVT